MVQLRAGWTIVYRYRLYNLLCTFTDRTINSMTCEKQFIPQDDRSIYCSEG